MKTIVNSPLRLAFQPTHVHAVLFDLDGTLLDTAPDLVSTLNQLLQEEGRQTMPFEEVRPYVSLGAAALVRLGFADAVEPAFSALHKRFLGIYRNCLAAETRIPEHVSNSLQRLEKSGVAWGIVTNKPSWLTEPLLELLNLRQRAQVVVSGDTLTKCKPHPEPLLHAAHQLGVDPADCIYIGDAHVDVAAARAAGMRVFVALFGYIPEGHEPRHWPADGWLDDTRQMVQLLETIADDFSASVPTHIG